ncbi:MAG: pyridoxamine 5'-phosphate oxidase family protein [Nitrospinota bacterium]
MAQRPTDMDDLLAKPVFARVATTNKDGSPHCVPLLHGFNPSDGTFDISTGVDSLTVRNLRRNPAIAVLVDDGPPNRGILAVGVAEVSGPMGKDHEYFTPLLVRYVGEGMVEKVLQGPTGQKERVRIKARPKRWKFWDTGRGKMGSVNLD